MITVEFVLKGSTLISSINSRKSIKFKTPKGIIYTGKDIYHVRINLLTSTCLLDKSIRATELTDSTETALLKAVETSSRLLPPIPKLKRLCYSKQ